MSDDAKIAALKNAAEEKKQRAAENLEKAIRKLTQENKPITFANIAREAGLSVSYLYKYPEIKERIETLRKQQLKAGKPTEPQKASDNSKAVIIYQLRERIKQLEAEVTGLRRVNEGIAGRLYHLQGADDLAERLKVENTELKQQLEECHRYHISPPPPQDDPKVTSIEKKRSKKSGGSDNIKSELDALKIKMNSTLSKLIGQAPEGIVLKAIDALKEALVNTKVRSPSGFLVEAIKNTWIPNEEYEEKVELNAFNEWYPLARSLKLVEASMKIEGVQCVCTPEGEWVPFEEMVAKYPLERLREMA